ncbi:sigma-70 family RNA polymerase sigma factor [Actinoplanes sp. NPDC048988]|uniref:sigma-70 family RNA polymerase sigma factor n=1 Tax=Actinoplanes sp. NPDC048988 TaxID=3363901 RepID=UPI003713C0AB
MTRSRIALSLVRDAQAGSTAARDALIAEHLPLIYNIIGRALDGHPDVDDLVQDTMLRAIRGLPSLREPARFRSWLIAIAYRQIQMHLRAKKSAPRLPLTFDVPDPAADFAERTTAELVVAEQRRELIEAARWLDEGDRRLLSLWWQEAAGELTRSELAAALQVRPKHAAVRVQRMKAQLDAARSVVRALRSRPRCPTLQDQVRRWNGIAAPLWRKRLMRHVRDCPRCTLSRHGLLAPEELLLGIAALPVPAGVASALLTPAALSGTAKASALPKFAAAAAAAAAVAGGGFAYAVYETPLPAPPPAAVAPPPVAVRPSAPGAAVRGRTPTASPAAVASALPIAGLGVQRADVFVAPNGSDSGDGSFAHPYASIHKAVSAARTRQTIALRGGTYRLSSGVTISSTATGVTVSNYRDEQPVIDASSLPASEWAVTQRTVNWTVQGLSVINSAGHAYVCSSCRSTVFRHLIMRNNARSGLLLRDPGTTGNQVLDSDFTGGGGIGLGFMAGDGDGNRVRGNRFAGNARSGLDLNFAGPVTVEYNWSYDNGGNGFVLTGGAPHRLRHNAAWTNANHGFTDDAGPVSGLTLTNNTAYDNGGSGFALPGGPAVLRTNAAVDNRIEPAGLAPGSTETRNSWQEDNWTPARFRSTDPTTAENPRPPSGRLPATIFLATGNGIGASMGG